MSFEPIKFVYTPPATVEEPLPQESSYTPNTTTNNPNVDQESTATNAATSFAVAPRSAKTITTHRQQHREPPEAATAHALVRPRGLASLL